ncbi:MAG: TlpA disulfide reductase family protein [Flavobacterium sp.]|uniref:TlpA family protein disulfide reductase n=1 Tax=Flavobacterium sp. TaxID=239 RepID=UPI00352754AE
MKKLLTLVTTLLVTVSLFAQENMTFQANVTNKNGDVLFIKNGRTIVKEIKADEKGEFKATFPIKEGLYQLFDGAEYAQLFLKPGYDLKMTLDGAKFDETIKFTGKGSNENNFIAAQTLAEQKFDYNGMLALDEAAFNKAFDEKLNGDIARLDKQTGLDANFVTTYKAGISQGLQGLKQYYAQISANKKLNNTKSPGFDFENHKGGKTSLESLKGKYVYIDVWATWCGPCRAEIPFLKEIEAKYHDKNIEFVSISADVQKDYEKWKTFVTEKELGGIQLFADKNWESDFLKAYGINSIPRFILIDPNGIVVDADAARPSSPKLKEQLDSLLK